MAKPRNEQPSASEFGQLRAYLAQQGIPQAQIDTAIGTAVDNRDRATITEALRELIRNLPAA